MSATLALSEALAGRYRIERYFFPMIPPTSVQQQAWMAQWRSAALELALTLFEDRERSAGK